MCDRVPPLVQTLKFSSSVFILGIMFINLVPELDAQKPEICTEAARLRILGIELPALRKTGLDQVPYQ